MDRTVCCHGSPMALCKVCKPTTTTNTGPDTAVVYMRVECPDCKVLREELSLWKQAAFDLHEFGCISGDDDYLLDPDFKKRVDDAFVLVEETKKCR